MKIKEGFLGSRLIVTPLQLLQESQNNRLTNNLLIHSIGYYPNAQHHYFERENGCNEYILLYCTKGEGFVTINSHENRLKAGDFIAIPAGVKHKYGSSEHKPWSIYWIHFKGLKAAEFHKKLSTVNRFNIDDTSRIEDRQRYFDELINLLDGNMTAANHEYASLSLNQLLASFTHPDSFRAALYNNAKSSSSSSFINLAAHYMYENIDKKITLRDISSYFGYSESYFYRLFHSQTGCAPISYFLQLKIEKSCHLLQTTNLKINQISSRLGFESPLYFSKYFKKVTGISPKAFREQNS